MFRSLILIALFATLVLAQPRYIDAPAANEGPTCPAGSSFVNRSSSYFANFTGPTAVCIRNYQVACVTAGGLVKCNTLDAVCIKSDRSYSEILNSGYTTAMPSTTQLFACVSAGAYVHPEANVLMPAQCVTSFVVIAVVAVMVLANSSTELRKRLSGQLGLLLYILTVVVCICLLPSYYYLNGLMGVAAASIAIITFEMGELNPISVGMTACILTIMWFTFDNGLGYFDQNGALASGSDSQAERGEVWCKNYYRWSYVVDLETSADNTNSAITTSGPCVQSWLSAVYFFSVALKVLLLGFVSVGGQVYYDAIRHPLKESELPAPAKDESVLA